MVCGLWRFRPAVASLAAWLLLGLQAFPTPSNKDQKGASSSQGPFPAGQHPAEVWVESPSDWLTRADETESGPPTS